MYVYKSFFDTNFNSKCVFGLSFYSIQCCNNVFYSCFQRAVSRNHLHFKGNHPLKCQLIRISRFGGNKHTDRETHYHSIAWKPFFVKAIFQKQKKWFLKQCHHGIFHFKGNHHVKSLGSAVFKYKIGICISNESLLPKLFISAKKI